MSILYGFWLLLAGSFVTIIIRGLIRGRKMSGKGNRAHGDEIEDSGYWRSQIIEGTKPQCPSQ